MGSGLIFSWFGKTIDELKAILETDKSLTDEQKVELKKIIDEKEKQSK